MKLRRNPLETEGVLLQILVELKAQNQFLNMLCGMKLIEMEVKNKSGAFEALTDIQQRYRNARVDPKSARWSYP